jgi:hypothetical protein
MAAARMASECGGERGMAQLAQAYVFTRGANSLRSATSSNLSFSGGDRPENSGGDASAARSLISEMCDFEDAAILKTCGDVLTLSTTPVHNPAKGVILCLAGGASSFIITTEHIPNPSRSKHSSALALRVALSRMARTHPTRIASSMIH